MRRKRVLLIRARKAAGLTQEKAAYRLDVDRSTIARWESGETEPLPCLRPKLAKLLGITLTKLEELLLAVDTETDPSPAEEDPQSAAWRGTLLDGGDEHEALELARRVAASDVSTETLSRLEDIIDELAIKYHKSLVPLSGGPFRAEKWGSAVR